MHETIDVALPESEDDAEDTGRIGRKMSVYFYGSGEAEASKEE